MKCNVCNSLYNGTSKCPYCGMIGIVDLDGDSDILKMMASNYKNKILGNIQAIGIKTYTYRFKEGVVAKNSENRNEIATGKSCFNTWVWTQEGFAQNKGMKKLVLGLYIKTKDQGIKDFTVSIPCPEQDDFWQVGIRIDENLRLCVALGTREQYNQVNDLDLPLVKIVKD